MARKISKEEMNVLQVVEKLPFAAEDKKAWEEIIQHSGVNEEMVKDIVAKSAELSAAEDEDQLTLARNIAELNRIIHQWRLAENLGGFGDRRRQRRR
jgi:hypothetical protein